MLDKKCKICGKKFKGRTDKIFCSVKCKNFYHINLRKATDKAVDKINKILHRNRSILLEIMGKQNQQMIVNRKVLELKKLI